MLDFIHTIIWIFCSATSISVVCAVIRECKHNERTNTLTRIVPIQKPINTYKDIVIIINADEKISLGFPTK